jgi:glutamate/aspartate transport system ATP-binding protein
MAMIDIKGVSKWYGTFQVLAEATTCVEKGEVVVVCGPSGSGKSTLIKCVNGLEPFQQGEVVVDGISVGAKDTDLPKLRSRIGMVFQNFELFPHMPVLKNLTIAQVRVLGRSPEAAADKAMALLDRVGLRSQAGKFPGQLSGGQQQRVAIARALAMDPIAMLFDEPTSALDPIATARIEELITSLRDRVTVLIVTHNMQQAARVSDFTAFMYLGELVEFDETSKIFTNPGQKATEDYITGRYG